MFVEMELREIQINEESPGHQIIIISEKNGNRSFPIYIGSHEAMAMDLAVRKIHPPRPLTHDLITNILEGLGVTLERVLIDDLRNDTFHGKLVLRDPAGKEVIIDSRPSDAIVLASRLE
ncbi:bifunctional nuclease family protein, partial [Candidatus Sumerlaeota bacterium]|nr:bifunctional nuclease family protein [Candidatus Sumerlaeota bacterium]